MDRDALVSDIKKKLVSALNLQGMPEDSIGSDTPLFGEDGSTPWTRSSSS